MTRALAELALDLRERPLQGGVAGLGFLGAHMAKLLLDAVIGQTSHAIARNDAQMHSLRRRLLRRDNARSRRVSGASSRRTSGS